MKHFKFVMLCILLIFLPSTIFAQEGSIKITNEIIYQKLLELEKNQVKFEEKFNSIDKRFEQIEKRFAEFKDYVDKRFDQIDKRFEDINKRFEDINKRFEDINKRFEDLIHLFGVIVAAFVALVVAIIAFAFWDRKTIISAAKNETIKEIEKEGRLVDLIASLRELAQEDNELRKVLKDYHLM